MFSHWFLSQDQTEKNTEDTKHLVAVTNQFQKNTGYVYSETFFTFNNIYLF